MNERTHSCPICGDPLPVSSRYPDYICSACVEKAKDELGRPVEFYNVSVSGGFKAVYIDTQEERNSHVCFIEGRRCWASEAHLGGIVVQPVED